jgi:hypothetical protein
MIGVRARRARQLVATCARGRVTDRRVPQVSIVVHGVWLGRGVPRTRKESGLKSKVLAQPIPFLLFFIILNFLFCFTTQIHNII